MSSKRRRARDSAAGRDSSPGSPTKRTRSSRNADSGPSTSVADLDMPTELSLGWVDVGTDDAAVDEPQTASAAEAPVPLPLQDPVGVGSDGDPMTPPPGLASVSPEPSATEEVDAAVENSRSQALDAPSTTAPSTNDAVHVTPIRRLAAAFDSQSVASPVASAPVHRTGSQSVSDARQIVAEHGLPTLFPLGAPSTLEERQGPGEPPRPNAAEPDRTGTHAVDLVRLPAPTTGGGDGHVPTATHTDVQPAVHITVVRPERVEDPARRVEDRAQLAARRLGAVFEAQQLYPPDVVGRISAMLGFSLPGAATYSMLNLPFSLRWGTGRWNRTICEGPQVVRVWTLGHLAFKFFSNATWTSSVNIDPFTQMDFDRSVRVLRDLSTDRSLPAYEDVRFSALQGRPGSDEFRAFDSFYDARERFTSTATMTRLEENDFRLGDLVFVEATISKYTDRTTRRDRASFNLISLCLVRSADAAMHDIYTAAREPPAPAPPAADVPAFAL